ncbi:MAG: S-layer homology domain-containing protein [Anaerovoracaceae bacterium]|jgi:hypothetical protein
MKGKRWIAFILVLVMVVGSITSVSAGSKNYSDLPKSHWAFDNVEKMSRKDIISGYPDGSFQPNKQVTYAEFIKMVITAIRKGEITPPPPKVLWQFERGESEAKGHWAESYYEEGLDLRIYSSFTFSAANLDKPIPRVDVAVIAANIIDSETPTEAATILEKGIPDIKKVSLADYGDEIEEGRDGFLFKERKKAVINAFYHGIVTGYPNRTFKGTSGLTRAESAAVIDRIINPSSRVAIDLEKIKTPLKAIFIDGRTVNRKDLIKVMTDIDPYEIDSWCNEAAVYLNGGSYSTEITEDGHVLRIGYKRERKNPKYDEDKQNARIKFLLQHYLQNDWERCYNDYINLMNSIKKEDEYPVKHGYYNGLEVYLSGGYTSMLIEILETRK